MIARCFIALDVGDAALDAARDAQQLLGELVRKSAHDSMHLTVKFLGSVDVDLVARPVFAAIAPLVSSAPPLSLGQGRIDGFPSLARAHVIVLECDGADVHLVEIATRADDAAFALGVERDGRLYRPHITLARSRKPFDARKVAARFVARPLGFATRLVLYESTQTGYVALDSINPTTPRSESS